MKDINKPCGDNLGGVLLFRVALVDDVQSIPLPINGKVCEPVVMQTGKQWYDVYGTPGTMGFSEDETPSDHRSYFVVEINASIPKDRTEVRNSLDDLREKKCIVDCLDSNLERRLVGTITEPLKCITAFDTTNKVTGKNAHTIKILGSILQRSPTYFI